MPPYCEWCATFHASDEPHHYIVVRPAPLEVTD